jgi:SAM-dependent methyltransferase
MTGPKTELGVTFQPEAVATSPAEVRARHGDNRAAWNEAAGFYARKLDAAIARLGAGRSSLHEIERRNLGELKTWCDTAIHLQCASGEDTLSLWLEGAKRVVGVDISDVHIANAERASAALGAPATWHRCDVLDAPAALDDTADLVYTGQGALCWLHDLESWARVIARLLKPGGVFHVLDDHPVTWLFDMEAATLAPSGLEYFRYSESSKGWPGSYIKELDLPPERQATKHERLWSLASVFGALTNAGLTVEHLGEHTERYWRNFPNLTDELRATIPMTFSMMARRRR